jgi:cyclic pyranopterin phosphate synthase
VVLFFPVTMAAPRDTLGRPLRDLRISVTDRCNFRCPYCMPREAFGPDHRFLDQAHLMAAAEVVRLVRVFRRLGVEKVRLTGGEPLIRRDLPAIIAAIKAAADAPEVSLTTNGWFLAAQASALRAAGLDRVNVSVDSLDPAVAGRMNGLGFDVARVLAGIEAATAAGLPVKVNCVIQRGVNEGGLLDLCRYFRARRLPLRFIEYMDVGNTNHWQAAQVVPAAEVLARVAAEWPLEPLVPAYRGEVAARYRYQDGLGEIGLISSVTEPFCRDCHRARLSANGRLYTCLFAATGTDLLAPLRAGADDDALERLLGTTWGARTDRYSDERAELAGRPRAKVEMSFIGG